MKTKIGSVLLTLLPFFGMAEEANYTQIDLSGMTADMVITGKDNAGAPAQYTTSDRKAIHAFNGDGVGAGGTHTNSANGTMFMSSAFYNSGTPYSYPIYLQVDLGEVKAIDRVKFYNFNMVSGSKSYTVRGVKDFELYTSTATAWKTSVAEITNSYAKVLSGALDSASGSNEEAGQVFDLETTASARYVALVINSQQGYEGSNAADKEGFVEYVGLSELMFFTKEGSTPVLPDPEPEEPEEPAIRTEVIVDNTDSLGVEISGSWAASSYSSNRYGSNYLHNGQAASEDLWVRFTPVITTNTTYDVSLVWNGDNTRGSAVPVEIIHAEGVATNYVDMTDTSTGWHKIGNWPFAVGTAGSVRILTIGQEGKTVIADAVKFVVAEPTPDPEPEDPADGAQISICCVGDSITEGANSETAANKWTYRLYLPELLAAQGLTNIAWKGSHVSPYSGTDLRSEGWCGKSAAEIANVYVANAATDKADYLLLHAGHNYDVTAMPTAEIIAAVTNAHSRIIAAARAQNPRTTILEAKVITSGKLPKYGYIPELNEAIGALAAELDCTESPVVLVDMSDGWDYTEHCISDKVHPTEAGARRMAEKWCAALLGTFHPVAPGTDWLIEAESMTEKGGWVVDPQFTDIMGSPYLLAHGKGVPVADATMTLAFSSAGRVRAWVRTRDWTPDWDGEKPGRFRLQLGDTLFPNPLGVAPADWGWVDAGAIDVNSGVQTLALKDLTGFEGRCDAIFLTSEENTTPPPAEKNELTDWRAMQRGESEAPEDVAYADFVVVGGGIAGTAAAVAAADAGLDVAIVQDRPMLGGNASDEIRVRTEKEGNEFHWIVKAIRNNVSNGGSMAKDDAARMHFAASYTNLSIHTGWRAYGVVTNEERKIVAVDARHVETGARRRFVAPLYADCTGDGWLGYWAGAAFMLGREAKTEYDEPVHGQDVADTSTMGNTLLWTTKTQTEDSVFPPVPWATKVSGNLKATSGGWDWEAGLDPDEDTIEDAEMLRDRLFRAIYGTFSNVKTNGNEKLVLNFMGYIAGKRESRRIIGDYVVREKDVTGHRLFEDSIGIATWSIDLHRKNGTSGFLAATTHYRYGNWWMPYRSLCCRDVPNLFLAGRCASYTHVAFGSSRVMHAGGQQGVAVGYAASLCKKYGCRPRAIYQDAAKTAELQSLINAKQSSQSMSDYEWPVETGPVTREILSLVVDNSDAAGVEVSGVWKESSSNEDHIGPNYLHNNYTGGEDLWVRFTPDIPSNTTYEVSLYWNAKIDEAIGYDKSRGTNIFVEVVYDGGVATNSVDMSTNPKDWVSIGSWPFAVGTDGSVRILTIGQGGGKEAGGLIVIADAVKFSVSETIDRDSTSDLDGNGLDDDWEREHFLQTSGTDPDGDPDGDGLSNVYEFIVGSDPHLMSRPFTINGVENVEEGTLALTWTGVPGRTYQVMRADSLSDPFLPYGDPIVPSENGTLTVKLPTADAGSGFYKIEVRR